MADDDIKRKLEDYEKYQRSISDLSGEWADDMEKIVDLSNKLGRSIRSMFDDYKNIDKLQAGMIDSQNMVKKLTENILENNVKIESRKFDIAKIDADVLAIQQENARLTEQSMMNENQRIGVLTNIAKLESWIQEYQAGGLDYGEAYEAMLESRQKFLMQEESFRNKGLEINTKFQKNETNIGNLMVHRADKVEEINKFSKENVDFQNQISNQHKIQADFMQRMANLQGKLILYNLLKLAYDRFVELDKAAEDFRKQTGFSNTQMVELRKNAESINVEFRDMGVGISEVYASAKALTDVFGRTSLVSREAMQNVSLLAANLNVAVEDSAAVLATFQGLGDVSQEAAMNIMKVGAGFSEKAGIPFSLVMKDIANAAGDTLSLIGANPTALMKSAIAARALGTDLNKLVSSQRKLLDFTTSMNDELTLSALIGKNVSFQEVRRLALIGKTELAAKAALDIVKAAGDFDSMNFIQREQLAKAAGMELKDLTKMLAVDKQRLAIENGSDMVARKRLREQTETLRLLAEQNDLTKQGLLDANENSIRQQKMQGIMAKLKNTMESIVVSLADILEPIITALATTVVPIFKVIASIAKVLSPFFKGLLAPIQFIAEAIGGWADSLSNFMDKSKGVADFFKYDLVKGILGTLGAGGMLAYLFFGKGGPRSLMTMIAKPFKAAASMAKDIFTNATKKGLVGDFIGPKLPSSVDEVGKISKVTKDVKSGTGIKDFLSNLATGLTKMGTGKVFVGAVNLGAAAVAFTVMTAGILGLGAVALLGEAVGLGLIALSLGLSALGNPKVGLGVLVLMGVSAAFIGFAYAGKLAAEAFTSIAKAIPDAIGPFIKLALISPLLYAAAGAISALSLSLALFAGASIGGKLVSFFAGDPFEKFQKLADLSERLKMSADAMKDISMAAASFVSINAFADSISKLADSLGRLNDQLGAIKSEELSKLSQIASATTAPNTTTPTANTTLNTSGVEDKLDKLTNLLVGGAVRVYLNGKLVNSAMTIDAG